VDAGQANMMLERLRNSLEQAEPPVANFPLVISFGCATALSPKELMMAFEDADHRMYSEKRRKQKLKKTE
jgi:GGDEF domain-containing protein